MRLLQNVALDAPTAARPYEPPAQPPPVITARRTQSSISTRRSSPRPSATGVFQSRGQALDQALELLKGRAELLRSFAEGRRQLAQGEGIVIESESELDALFASINAEGRNAYRAGKRR